MGRFWTKLSREYRLLIMAWAMLGVLTGLYDPVFNNYLHDVFHISTQVRGYLEFPRELPGFLIAIISGLLMFLADVRLLGVAVALTTLGLVGQSFYIWQGQPQFGWMIGCMVLWSIGLHLFIPLSSSVSVRLAPPGQAGRTLGLMNAVNIGAVILGCGLVMLLMGWLKFSYAWVFRVAAGFGVLAVIFLLLMRVRQQPTAAGPKLRLTFKKEYSLYYYLSMLFGIRKQVFITFGPWVLVKVFQQPPRVMALLLLIASFLGLFFRIWLGRLIDRLGERRLLQAEAICFLAVCLGYAGASHLGLGKYALYLIFACYITDLLLSGVAMARTTYLHKNLVQQSDFTPTLALGVSLDHAVAMTMPILGGLLWAAWGYEAIFLAAAVLAIANWRLARRVPDHPGVPTTAELATERV